MVLIPSILYALARAGIWSGIVYCLIFVMLVVFTVIKRNANSWRRDLNVINLLKLLDFCLKLAMGLTLLMVYIIPDMTLGTIKFITMLYIGLLFFNLASIAMTLIFRIFFEANKAYNFGDSQKYPEFPPMYSGQISKVEKQNSVLPMNQKKVLINDDRDGDDEENEKLEDGEKV